MAAPIYRYFVQLSYEGSAFNGWQRQDNALSVQESLELAFLHIVKFTGGLTGCGRTDTGVHARAYYAHFDHIKSFNTSELEKLVFRLNRYLPASIAIQRIFPVVPSAHARFSPVSREYKYYLLTAKDPFLETRSWYSWENLDVEAMNQAAKILQKFTDFECFSKRNTNVKTYNCRIMDAGWSREGDLLVFTIRADRFLRNMVRAIVGTLMDIGRHKTDANDLVKIIESKSRSRAGYSVPAKGLFLTDVVYPASIFTGQPIAFLQNSPDEIVSHHKADTKFHHSAGNEADE